VTDFTSLVAVDPEVTVPAGVQPVPQVVPMNLPEDGPVEDMITVTAESPLLDERRISTGCTVSLTELEKIPTTATPWVGLSEADSKSLCAEIQRTGWAKITLKQALAAAPSLAMTLREADRIGLLRGYLSLVLGCRGCTEPPADVIAEAGRYLDHFGG
jgi:hypothetical protein